MKFSIITPSYNQGCYLEKTILSVVNQFFTSLEFIIIDGNSKDNTHKVIDLYRDKINYIIIEKDNGQSEAINKGLNLASGDIVAWINSDDTYLLNSFQIVNDIFSNENVDFVYGKAFFIDENDQKLSEYPSFQIKDNEEKYKFWKGWPIPQPTVFFRRRVLEKIGLLNKNLDYALDFEFFLRISEITKLHYYPVYLANYRLHQKSKTGNWELSRPNFYEECINVVENRFPKRKFSNSHIWFSWYLYQLKMFIKKTGKYKFIP
jgi:glycosyltransferase involved in cell wall biosynthesis